MKKKLLKRLQIVAVLAGTAALGETMDVAPGLFGDLVPPKYAPVVALGSLFASAMLPGFIKSREEKEAWKQQQLEAAKKEQ